MPAMKLAPQSLTDGESKRRRPRREATKLASLAVLLYQTSERSVRFLRNELPNDRIVPFSYAILAGKPMQGAVPTVYADKFKDCLEFTKKYERFTK